MTRPPSPSTLTKKQCNSTPFHPSPTFSPPPTHTLVAPKASNDLLKSSIPSISRLLPSLRVCSCCSCLSCTDNIGARFAFILQLLDRKPSQNLDVVCGSVVEDAEVLELERFFGSAIEAGAKGDKRGGGTRAEIGGAGGCGRCGGC